MLGLTATPLPHTTTLETRVAEALDRHLSRDSPAPIGLALSGGGDSVALLLLALRWAEARGRRLTAFTVDHGLQPASAAWAQSCARLCADLGVAHQTLVWTGDKPERGLPAAARQARHRLIAEAARAAGVRVVLFGHTADDAAEAALMRAQGSTTPSPRLWTPCPVWPEGRGLFILRPLMATGRAELRDWLRGRRANWVEDPANADVRYARARARRELAGARATPEPEIERDALAELAKACAADRFGGLALPRERLRAAPQATADAFAAAASLCAAGGARPPSSAAARRLADALRGEGLVTATLAGARIEADASVIRWMREAGEAARGGLLELQAEAGARLVWDGRFEVTAAEPITIRPLRGLANRLPPPERDALQAIPASARAALPAIVQADGSTRCPLLSSTPLSVRALAYERLLAACGGVLREP